jgi:RNA polymerase sigma-70 factor (ECF subfamily)
MTSLEQALAASRAAWPEVKLADATFAAHLDARVPAGMTLAAALPAMCVADLYLACAIEQGDAAALRAFESYLTQIDIAIAHLDGGSALADDVRTAVRERVLAHGGKGKLAEYRGRGDLRGWLRVVAVREALQLLRARRREAPMPDDLADKLVVGAAAMTSDEQRAYKQAFATALGELTPRERNLLRQHYLHGATVDDLGALYGVHRATPARWIAQIRETLLRRTRQLVGAALRLTGTELDSAMDKLASHVDYSLRHTLSYER